MAGGRKSAEYWELPRTFMLTRDTKYKEVCGVTEKTLQQGEVKRVL